MPSELPSGRSRTSPPRDGPSAVCAAARAHTLGQLVENGHRRIPTQACVGDALAIHEMVAIDEVLTAVDEEALHHDAEDASLALGELGGDLTDHERLAAMVLLAVAVAGVDHQPGRNSGVTEGGERLLHAHGVVVRATGPAEQDHVAVGIAARRHDAGQALLGDAEEAVRMGGRAQGVDGDLYAAVRAVLEAHRHRARGGELAMRLALRGARAD